MQGLVENPNDNGPTPEILETLQPDRCDSEWFLAHARIGRNLDPSSKLQAFVQLFDSGSLDSVRAAMLKFCYVDIDTQLQAETLFEEYVTTVGALARKYPGVSMLHCTIPLRRLPAGPYATLRQLLGHRHAEYGRNRAREWFNDRMRGRFRGQGVFDLALLESTHADGRRCLRRIGRERVPSLAPELTDDGGHLNMVGRRMIAAEFLRFILTVGSR